MVQNIARALPAESFAALAGSLTLTTVRDRVIEVRGPGDRVMTYEEFFWDDNDPVGDPENPDDVDTARWLGILERPPEEADAVEPSPPRGPNWEIAEAAVDDASSGDKVVAVRMPVPDTAGLARDVRNLLAERSLDARFDVEVRGDLVVITPRTAAP